MGTEKGNNINGVQILKQRVAKDYRRGSERQHLLHQMKGYNVTTVPYFVAFTMETTMMTIITAIARPMMMRIFISFHHIFFLTLFAPRRKPCADTARLSVLSCSESNLSPLSATLVMLSLIISTVSSICAWIAAVFAF
jgi:hypothetical protein